MEVDFEALYGDAFPEDPGIRTFVCCVENASIDPEKSRAKITLNTAARNVWIADRLEEIAPGRQALQVLFYMVAAEAVAKLFIGYAGRGASKKHVMLFFAENCDDAARERLDKAFRRLDESFLTWKESVEFLYQVRCDVAHEGVFDHLGLEVQPGVQWYTPSEDGPLGVCITPREIR